MQNKQTSRYKAFERLYMNGMQAQATLIDSNKLFAKVARGTGKTEGVIGPRSIRVKDSMPGELSFFIHATYVALLSNIIPNLRAFYNKPVGPHGEPLLKEGEDYVIGTAQLPKHFRTPRYPVSYPKHSIVFSNGHQFQLVASDQPDSVAGRSAQHAFIEEMKHNKGQSLKSRVFPALRGASAQAKQSYLYEGITGVSDVARVDLGEDNWFNDYENHVDKELIDEIATVSEHVNHAQVRLTEAQSHLKDESNPAKLVRLQETIRKNQHVLKMWEPTLRDMRKASTYFITASTFANKDVLGTKYFQTQREVLSDDEFLSSICNIERDKVVDMFFCGYDSDIHAFDDSYKYDSILSFDLKDTFNLDAQYLKHYDPTEPLKLGYDPGQFSSIVVAQEKRRPKELRTLKNFYCWPPEDQADLARRIYEFFGPHQKNKRIDLYYDRAGNKRKEELEKITTDAKIMKRELESYGFKVVLKNERQKTIFYYQHYRLLKILLSENLRHTPRIRVCKHECKELNSAINRTAVKRVEGKLEMDKSSELLPFYLQPALSSQIPSALTYLIYGLYAEEYLPSEFNQLPDDLPDNIVV
ncbi:hypothetical protein [Carboxylicivirga marina]|uniref:hypothetical protein n=1 Tax=Carboxylicivirga marina TaxID=2800988 RepID=UPI00259A4040|nr:hypothetical protein [uncultured Carboxylicivirga sp.]